MTTRPFSVGSAKFLLMSSPDKFFTAIRTRHRLVMILRRMFTLMLTPQSNLQIRKVIVEWIII